VFVDRKGRTFFYVKYETLVHNDHPDQAIVLVIPHSASPGLTPYPLLLPDTILIQNQQAQCY